MKGHRLRLLRLLHVPLCVACAGFLASWHRPRPFRPPPPPPGTARWLWFDRGIRFERWHPTLVIAGSHTGAGERAADRGLFVSGHNVTDTVTAQPNGTLLVSTYNFYQFNLWPAVWPSLAISGFAALYEWRVHMRARRRAGLCPRCGYDLRATPDQCPECGAVPGRA